MLYILTTSVSYIIWKGCLFHIILKKIRLIIKMPHCYLTGKYLCPRKPRFINSYPQPVVIRCCCFSQSLKLCCVWDELVKRKLTLVTHTGRTSYIIHKRDVFRQNTCLFSCKALFRCIQSSKYVKSSFRTCSLLLCSK